MFDHENNVFEISFSVDELSWTKHWLGNSRCDHLSLKVAYAEDPAQITIVAVESKSSRSPEAIPIDEKNEPFRTGYQQVLATLSALDPLFPSESSASLVEELQFATFMENVFLLVLSEFYPINVDDYAKTRVIDALNKLSDHSDSVSVSFYGVVCLSQVNSNVGVKTKWLRGHNNTSPVLLVRVGSDDVTSVLAGNGLSLPGKPSASSGTSGPTASSVPNDHATQEFSNHQNEGVVEGSVGAPNDYASYGSGESTREGWRGAMGAADTKEPHNSNLAPAQADGVGDSSAQFTAEDGFAIALKHAEALSFACKQRNIPLGKIDQDRIKIAPSIYVIPFAIGAGASLREVESALPDVAREAGVRKVSVENDPDKAFHIRFFVARNNRDFPRLPENSPNISSSANDYLELDLGVTVEGNSYKSWLSTWPHMLVGGTTGSGKTTFLKSIVQQIDRVSPGYAQAIIIDGKGEVDFFNLLSDSMFHPEFSNVRTGIEEIMPALRYMVQEEIPRRKSVVVETAKRGDSAKPMSAVELYKKGVVDSTYPDICPLIIIVDEFAELMLDSKENRREFEELVQRIAQLGRSSLVHLILATQRPDNKIVSGAIKANLSTRVALQLPSHHDSMTILGRKGAEDLLGKGDLLFETASVPLTRLQGYVV